jgi:DNA-directed RNA polymerase sigma subunit (sigma70/sigma32)
MLREVPLPEPLRSKLREVLRDPQNVETLAKVLPARSDANVQRELTLLRERFAGKTQADLARQWGLSRERVSQIEESAIQRILRWLQRKTEPPPPPPEAIPRKPRKPPKPKRFKFTIRE